LLIIIKIDGMGRGGLPLHGSSVPTWCPSWFWYMEIMAEKRVDLGIWSNNQYCTAKISCKYQTVFLNHSVLWKCIFTHYWGLTHKNADLWGTCTMRANSDQLPLGVVKVFSMIIIIMIKCIISRTQWFSGTVIINTCHHLSPAKFGNRSHNGKSLTAPSTTS
jgi:hypothetical protein